MCYFKFIFKILTNLLVIVKRGKLILIGKGRDGKSGKEKWQSSINFI